MNRVTCCAAPTKYWAIINDAALVRFGADGGKFTLSGAIR